MRTYVFIDAENHFHRTCDAAEQIFGSPKAAEAIANARMQVGNSNQCVPPRTNTDRFVFNRSVQLFWDYLALLDINPYPFSNSNFALAVYACSCSGSEEVAFDARVQLRQLGFDPIVVHELKSHQKQRIALREGERLIDKAKGCDIAVATRIVADAAAGLYERCILFTSDADYLPAIEAVRRMGKVVWVYGFKDVLPKHSPYLHVPDKFHDLNADLVRLWDNNNFRVAIQSAIGSLD